MTNITKVFIISQVFDYCSTDEIVDMLKIVNSFDKAIDFIIDLSYYGHSESDDKYISFVKSIVMKDDEMFVPSRPEFERDVLNRDGYIVTAHSVN